MSDLNKSKITSTSRFPIKKKILIIAGILLIFLLLVYFAVRIYRNILIARYDSLPAPVSFTPEDITQFVDTNEDAKVSPSEKVLVHSIESMLRKAEDEDKRIFVNVGHLKWDEWFRFTSLKDLVLYCKLNHGFRNVHVEKTFHDIGSPSYSYTGYGAYLEIDGKGDFKALWVYNPMRAPLTHRVPRRFRLGKRPIINNPLEPFIDKHFRWERIPSTVLAEKIINNNASKKDENSASEKITTPTIIMDDDFVRHFQTFKKWKLSERDFAADISQIENQLDHIALDEESERILRTLIGEARECRTRDEFHALFMNQIDILKNNPETYKDCSHNVKLIISAICRKIIRESPAGDKSPKVEDALFYYAVLKSRETRDAVEVIETLNRLERDFPDGRYVPSIYIYLADAYANLAKDAYPGKPEYAVSYEAAVQYYALALLQTKKMNDYIKKHGDTHMFGITWGFTTTGSMLNDGMIDSEISETSKMLKDKIHKAMIDSSADPDDVGKGYDSMLENEEVEDYE